VLPLFNGDRSKSLQFNMSFEFNGLVYLYDQLVMSWSREGMPLNYIPPNSTRASEESNLVNGRTLSKEKMMVDDLKRKRFDPNLMNVMQTFNPLFY
jgi:hypothetical protein